MKNFFMTICAAIILLTNSLAYAEEPPYIDKFILWTNHRDELIDEYTLKHYGRICREIVPRAVIVHWTAVGTVRS
ncbi:MAG: N-acetylmuramoyl-L-alanine amidase, partial [Selenomonadaceae bacterium]|nr:N-acetylmuramoyl-L-alanine amidase [Selenomonadaceae bacterium]